MVKRDKLRISEFMLLNGLFINGDGDGVSGDIIEIRKVNSAFNPYKLYISGEYRTSFNRIYHISIGDKHNRLSFFRYGKHTSNVHISISQNESISILREINLSRIL